jgi:hypothetical protein
MKGGPASSPAASRSIGLSDQKRQVMLLPLVALVGIQRWPPQLVIADMDLAENSRVLKRSNKGRLQSCKGWFLFSYFRNQG